MIWNKHFSVEGSHAFLSPSQSSWVNYDDNKLIERFKNQLSVKRGTELHAYAEMAIKYGIKQPDTNETLYRYINDAIVFKMDPEIVLYFSKWCYGTADAISFRLEPKISKEVPTLRIHDLKTGTTPAKLRQLEVYAALFCLEYDFLPVEIAMVLRIYQFNDVLELIPKSEDIVPIMDKIKRFNDIIEYLEKDS